ncbi:MAG: ribosomal-protein-alanine N-acetyltransferase [Actinophytocola sp.]|nr:ribosomal-protein-alanine N-acetyltransferase [Actinophytocola sp.]
MTASERAAQPTTLAPLRRSDIPRCVEIEHLLFPGDDPWSAAAFRAELSSGAYYLGAYDGDGALLGYGGLAILGTRGNYDTEVHTIGVVPQWQGYGIGAALITGLLAKADALDAPVFLEVRTDNDAAIALYEKNGFVRMGVRKGYYQPSGADAYTMRRPPVSRNEVDR